MLNADEIQIVCPDCSTCSHRVERHKPKHALKGKPQLHEYVCLVTAKPISPHGIRKTASRETESGTEWYWVYEPPCKQKRKCGDKIAYVAADWDGGNI